MRYAQRGNKIEVFISGISNVPLKCSCFSFVSLSSEEASRLRSFTVFFFIMLGETLAFFLVVAVDTPRLIFLYATSSYFIDNFVLSSFFFFPEWVFFRIFAWPVRLSSLVFGK